jgi:hypothetical protein
LKRKENHYETIHDCHGDIPAGYFDCAFAKADFSGESGDGEHCRDTPVDERGGVHCHRGIGGLAVAGK